MQAISRFFDSIFLLRPVVIIPVWGFSLFGYYRGKQLGFSDIPAAWTHPVSTHFFWIVVFSLSVGCVYVLNQIADFEVDKKNGGLPLVASGIVSRTHAWIVAVFSGCASIVLPLSAGHSTIAWLSGLTLIIGWMYSFKPFYFSGRAGLDFLANAFGFGIIAFGCGWHLAGGSIGTYHFATSALPYFFLMCAGSISSTLPDIAGDRETGKRTTAVRFGARSAHLIATGFMIATVVSGIAVQDRFILVSAGIALPLYFVYLIRPSRMFEEATYKIGGAACMTVAAVLSPIFVAAGVLTAGTTWMYFRYRHHVTYPSLVPLKHEWVRLP